LTHPENAEVAWAMVDVMRGVRARLQMSKFMFLHHDKKWLASVKTVRDFVDGRIDKTLTELESRKKLADPAVGERTDLLWDIARQLPDKESLRGQIMAVFIPSNDTTSILISNAMFALVRHPHVWEKLRREVLALGDLPLTFERLRGLRYLNYIINESR
jgi:cytochrome P450 monooxygenase